MKKNQKLIILLLCSLLLFCLEFCFFNKNVLKIFKPLYNNFAFMVELNSNSTDNSFVVVNDKIAPYNKIRNFLFFNSNKKIDNIKILSDIKDENIKSVFIYDGIKPYYFNDFSNFKKQQKELCLNDKCNILTLYDLPDNFYKKNRAINSNSLYNYFCVFLLSIFSGYYIFIPFYILFGIFLFLVQINSDIKFNRIYSLFVIFVFALILRVNGFFDTLLMYDDYYTLDLSTLNFLSIFKDPGNPPLLYFIYHVYFMIFPLNIYFGKALALFISVLMLFCCYYFSEKEFGYKISNLFLFLVAINIHFIHRAFELRGYILQCVFTVLLTYLLFKIINSFSKKYLIFYCLCAIAAINLHFYEILFLAGNYIFAFFMLYKKNEKRKLVIFSLIHLIPIITFLPYFFYTALNKGLLNESFNTWIAKTDFNMIKSTIYYLFGGLIPFVFYLFYFIKSLYSKGNKYRTFIIYSLYNIFFILLSAVLISQFKPVLVERYMLFLIPLVLINIALFFSLNKKHIIVFFIWILLIQNYAVIKKNNKNKGLDLVPISASSQYKLQNASKNVYAIIRNFTYSKNIDNFKFIDFNKDVNYKIIDTKKISIEEMTKDILSKDKDAVIFTLLFEMNEQNLKKYTCYFNMTQDICLWKIN